MTTVPAFDKALELLSKSTDPIADILRSSCYWIPLQFVYVQMAKNKDIVRLSELPGEKRLEIWTQIKKVNPDCVKWEKWKQRMVMQSVYVFEIIK